MTSPSLFKEYIWLIGTIYRARRISLREINRLWRQTEMSGGVDFSRTTFNRHKDAIQDIFGIYIECDRLDGYRYYIGNSRALETDTVQNWMLQTLSVSNAITESKAVNDRILLEATPANNFLTSILEAMKKERKLEITHRKYGAQEAKKTIVEPYALKAYRQRWYLLTHARNEDKNENEDKDSFRVYGLDRVEHVRITDERFKLIKNFDASEYFHDCFGIVVDNNISVENIILRAYGNEGHKLLSVPLHPSQELIRSGEGYMDFQYHFRPTLDFCAHILSRGRWMRVMQPQSLIEQIKTMHREAYEMYEGSEK